MKIIVLDGYPLSTGDLSWKELEKLGEVIIYDKTQEEDILAHIGDAEIIFTNKTPLTKEILEKTKVKWIGVLATGYNVVDVEGARDLGILVANVPTYGNDAVAQFTFALLLELCSGVGLHDKLVKEGEWEKRNCFSFWNYSLMELKNKSLGIIGLGRNGEKVAEIATAFGMKILAYDRFKNEKLIKKGYEYLELDEVFEKSDIISLHCPLTAENENLICEESINKMKEGVIIINTARGGLIKDEDLARALTSGKVRGAGLDVVSVEPINNDNPLLKAPNCIITPHIAWAPKEARERLLDIAINNLKEYLKGNPTNIVN